MKTITTSLVLLQALAVQGVRIIQSNDDGWAESYIRTFNDALIDAGHDVLLSAPADNQSGKGSLDSDPSNRTEPCEYDSCPANSGPYGSDPSRADLNWVNSYPATSMRYGLDVFAPEVWGSGVKPDIAVTGPNVGSNLWVQVPFSGTVGSACYAVEEAGIPAIAFSGLSSGNVAFDATPVPERSLVYAELAATLTEAVIASGKPYLPDGVFLNVNFPKVEGGCTAASDFSWVLSRINPGFASPEDVDWCGSTRLPTETHVTGQDGCYISVSVGDASDKTTVNDDRQATVLEKLKDLLVCLP
ncbi:Survival protein SurE [Geosmithia morbida]|uniref:Survival protein SurE n=1 Tax=Geosmithia morbida TaxID=1094350 RepID=A0A9P5D4H4_9HYPO|nr:Survival protein SurE [Geosmithia morbida]KAF4121504.1 Survival protein SurE [Geosmithia morbida]